MSLSVTEGSPIGTVVIAVVLTALLVVSMWGFSPPPLPSAPALALSTLGGAVIGFVGGYLAGHPRNADLLDNLYVFLALLVAAVGVRFVFFPEGVPTVLEIGLLVAVWGVLAGELYWSRQRETA